MISRQSVGLLAFALLAACAEAPLTTGASSARVAPRVQPPKFWEANAAVDWNTVARERVAANNSNALVGIRVYAIVSLAQYNAAIAAEDGAKGGARPSMRAAISAASVAALSYLYPQNAALLESRLDSVLATEEWPSERRTNAAIGEALGRAAAAKVIARAQADGYFAPWSGTVPTGPGYWYSNTPPAGPMIGQARPFFLSSGNQFRPAPPPAFGTAEFQQAVAEVREIADTRTASQVALAAFWNLPAGTYTPAGYWNAEASRLALHYRLRERDTAHLLALMNMVSFDAVVASHEAKYHYWLLRPSMADAGITLPIGLPNFPSYPSNHAAISAGMARIIGAEFPSERRRLDGLAEEAALSRVLGGIHYRFDGEAGLELGRAVAAWASAHDVRKGEPFPVD